MGTKLFRTLGTALLAAALCLQATGAHAEIVSTDQLATQDQADAERGRIQAFLDQASVKERLAAMGVDGLAADGRVAALNEQEVHALAGRIDALPSGGNIGSFTDQQLIIVLLVAILVALLVG
jgi:hypothetical protein